MTRLSPAARVAAAGVLLALAAVALELAPGTAALRRVLRDGFGPEGAADGRSARLLRQLGLDPETGGWPSARPEDAPSSRAVGAGDLAPGQWLVSVALPDESLHDPSDGILANPEGRGRRWERVAWVSLYHGRRLVLATRAGLRVHGGASRGQAGREGFRIVFRPSYGLPRLPPDGPLATVQQPPDRFVIRRSSAMPQAQPVAFALARRIGAVAPAAVAARFVLNGALRPEAYELTEQVAPEGWGRSYFGHDDFHFHQYKAEGTREADEPYDHLEDWVSAQRAPLRLARVAERIDTDNLARHILTIMYCGTHDWAQGAAVLDLRSADRRWFWVLWDLDTSFRGLEVEPWRRPSVAHFTAPHPIERSDLRGRLFRRLLREDPAFAPFFAGVAAEALNHRLTPAFLRDLVRRSEPLSVSGPPFGGFDLQAYFDHRGDVLFDAIARALGRPRPHVVHIQAPDGARLRVDGYDHGQAYRGRYFDGQTVSVEAAGADGASLLRWSVDGASVDGSRLSFAVHHDTVIRAGGSE